jgi:hypothetical protein
MLLEKKNSVNLKFPGKLTVSAGIGESRKWLVESSTKIFRTSEHYNNFDNVGYGKYGNVSLGGYYIPDYNSFSSYVKNCLSWRIEI